MELEEHEVVRILNNHCTDGEVYVIINEVDDFLEPNGTVKHYKFNTVKSCWDHILIKANGNLIQYRNGLVTINDSNDSTLIYVPRKAEFKLAFSKLYLDDDVPTHQAPTTNKRPMTYMAPRRTLRENSPSLDG